MEHVYGLAAHDNVLDLRITLDMVWSAEYSGWDKMFQILPNHFMKNSGNWRCCVWKSTFSSDITIKNNFFDETVEPYSYFRFDILIVLRALLLQQTDPEKWDKLIDLEAHLGKRGQGSKIHRLEKTALN